MVKKSKTQDERTLTSASKVLDEAKTSAWKGKAYNEALTSALKAIDEAQTPASKAYREAKASALKAYNEARASARKTYEEAIAPTWKAYDEVVRKQPTPRTSTSKVRT